MLSTPGIGSGLDINSIITQLMTIERRPLVRLGVAQVELEAELSAFGKLKSSVSLLKSATSDLSDPAKFRFMKATSSADEALAASADSTAAKGRYTIEVQRVAENHRLAAATVFADTDATRIGLAGDTMSIQVGNDVFVVDIGDKTLDEIRSAINEAADNAGVIASTIKDDAGYHLTLAAEETGSSALIDVSYSGADPFALATLNLDRDASGNFDAADLDAVMLVEGAFTITRASNTVSDAIRGVTLTLAGTGTSIVEVRRDDAKIAGSVQQLMGVYNEVIETLGALRADVLASERGALVNLEAQFRGILNSPAGTSSAFSFLSEIGVSTGLDGRLSLNTAMFNSALADDPDGVADLFTHASSGIATRFEALATTLVDSGGLFDNREQSLKARIDDIADKRVNLESRLVQKEATLVQQYSTLDALLAQLNTTSSFLGTQLDQIAANTRFSNGG